MNQQIRLRRAWLKIIVAVLLCMLPALAHAGALRPDSLQAESGCEHYRGTPIGANDSTQQFELMVCTTPEGVRAKVQTASLVSGWSVRQSDGEWRADGFKGNYVSDECNDRALLQLVKVGPVAAAANVPSPPSAPAQTVPAPERDVVSVKSDCTCDVAISTHGEFLLGLLALLGLSLVLRRRHDWRMLGLLAFVSLSGSGCIPECGGLNPNCEAKCTELGECGRRTYKAGDAFARCYVRSSDDCAQSQACKQRGACHLYDGIDPGNCVALTDLDCRQSSECAELGKCSLGDRGRCVVEPSGCGRTDGCKQEGKSAYAIGGHCVAGPADCKEACRHEGACTLRDGVCVATSVDDWRRSNTCGRDGQCSLEGDRCVAGEDDCPGSHMCALNGWCHEVEGGDACYDGRTECGQLCWERGDCQRIDGTCQPGDASSCAPSLACIVLGQCSLAGRPAVMCGADSDADCEQSLECKAFGRCTKKGIVCVDGSGRSRSSSIGCLRDPECATKGRCLTDDNGRCVTAVEAGIPDWKPDPPFR